MSTGDNPEHKPVALITGSGNGLGAAIALTLSSRGYRIAVHYHTSVDSAIAVQEQIGDDAADTFRADLRMLDECDELVRNVVGSMGRIDVLVNNASVLQRTPSGDLSADIWAETMTLNLRSVAFLSMHAAKAMKESHDGAILNIGDLAGLQPWPAYLAHAVSKAGVHHLTRCMARAYAPGIRVNAVAPGLIHPPGEWSEQRVKRFTDRIPGGSPADMADVAALAADIIGNPSVTGQIIAVDRGQSLMF